MGMRENPRLCSPSRCTVPARARPYASRCCWLRRSPNVVRSWACSAEKRGSKTRATSAVSASAQNTASSPPSLSSQRIEELRGTAMQKEETKGPCGALLSTGKASPPGSVRPIPTGLRRDVLRTRRSRRETRRARSEPAHQPDAGTASAAEEDDDVPPGDVPTPVACATREATPLGAPVTAPNRRATAAVRPSSNRPRRSPRPGPEPGRQAPRGRRRRPLGVVGGNDNARLGVTAYPGIERSARERLRSDSRRAGGLLLCFDSRSTRATEAPRAPADEARVGAIGSRPRSQVPGISTATTSRGSASLSSKTAACCVPSR